MAGVLYGIGVGAGDPELLTLKAARIIRECDIVAVPDAGAGESVALEIARAHVQNKPVLRCKLPMTRDEESLAQSRAEAANLLCRELDAGKDVAFLTLGDVTVYSTYLYLHKLVAARGYPTQMIAGVPSFCAAAAALGIGLCEAGQALHIFPASYANTQKALNTDGVKVFMKAGKKMNELLGEMEEQGLLEGAALAECVGMPAERLFHNLEGYDGSAGYFSTVILKGCEDAKMR